MGQTKEWLLWMCTLLLNKIFLWQLGSVAVLFWALDVRFGFCKPAKQDALAKSSIKWRDTAPIIMCNAGWTDSDLLRLFHSANRVFGLDWAVRGCTLSTRVNLMQTRSTFVGITDSAGRFDRSKADMKWSKIPMLKKILLHGNHTSEKHKRGREWKGCSNVIRQRYFLYSKTRSMIKFLYPIRSRCRIYW